MHVIDLLLRYMKCWEESLAMLRSPSVPAPFVVFAALELLVLMSLTFFFVPPISTVMVPVTAAVGGEKALHFPMHFILLPHTYHLLYLPLVVIVGFCLFGWAVSMMLDYYEHIGVAVPDGGRRRSPAFRSMLSLVVVGVVYVTVISVLQLLFGAIASKIGNIWASRLASLVGVAAIVCAQALLVYAPFHVVAHAENAVAAIVHSIRSGRRRFGVTVLILATVVIIHWPIDALLRHPDKVVLKFRPELVFFLLAAGIVVEMFTSYFLFASTTSLATGGRKEGV